MSLQGWDDTKKLKIIIDNNKIDEDLTDFPILVSLSGSVGTNNFDAGCVFDEVYANPYEVCDDFTGTNGSTPDVNLWSISSSSDVDIYNNKLRFANNNNSSSAYSEFTLSGDFNIQIDFELINGPSTDSWGADLRIYLNNNNDFFAVRRSYTGANHRYWAVEYIGGVGNTVGSFYSSTDTSGKLCIIRFGNTFSAYFWHSSGYWYLLGSKTYDMAENDIKYIRLRHHCWDGNPSFSFYFDNFKVNNGTPYFPSRLAITATVSGVETQCYSEIERWEQENNKAILWTKVSTIVSGSDTELSLYYDKSHLNNWDYVDFVGTTAGKAVWDSNFVGVWHMGQDPTGGSNCIKDSTASGSHGTPGGSMTSTDLVDGKVGKALDFDGSNDYVGLPTLLLSNITVNASINRNSLISDEAMETIIALEDSVGYFRMDWEDSDNTVFGYFYDGSTSHYIGKTAIGASQNYLATFVKSNNSFYFYLNGDLKGSDTGTIGSDVGLDAIGARNNIASYDYNWNGIIDEVSISNIARSAPWIKATYHSNWDSLFSIMHYTEDEAEADWIAGWKKRIKLTIKGQYIEEDLSNFPILVHLDSSYSCVFDELGSNSKRISVVNYEQQQCYVEIERWDDSTNNAWLWVKVPSLPEGTNSELYLYYDNLRPDNSVYVGTVGETPAQNVWDSNFVGVWHMNQDPTGGASCIKDSTSNSNNGTPAGSMTSGDLVDGKIGKALDFDGSDDYIDLLNQAKLIPENADFTLECLLNISTQVFFGGGGNSGDNWSIGLYSTQQSYVVAGASLTVNSANTNNVWGSVIALRSGNDFKSYLNGAYDTKETRSGNFRGCTGGFIDHLLIGARWVNGAADYFAKGIIDETRISNIVRSDSWIKATHYSNWNQLLTYGVEETVSSGILAGWENRLKLTIKNSNIDNDLTDFPVMVKLSDDSGCNNYDNRCVFDELEADINRKKIAITDSTGTAQCFVEIERFNHTEKEAVFWVKLPKVYDSVGTCFYLYYNKTKPDNNLFVGDVNSISAQNVWDSNFVGVWHMNQDPTGGSDCIKDSTSNINHGTPGGSMTSGDLVDGKIGKALDFDAVDDHINVGALNALNNLTGVTWEATAKNNTSTTDRVIVGGWDIDSQFKFWMDAGNDVWQGIVSDGTNQIIVQPGLIAPSSSYQYVVMVLNGQNLNLYIDSVNGGSANNASFTTLKSTVSNNVYIGANQNNNHNFNDAIDEVRISNIARSAPWIKATYHSNWDSLVIFEKEDITASWLSGWTKRIKLTIDHTKIDENLCNFPVLLNLDNSNAEVLFDELNCVSVNDTFTAVSGSVPDANLWSGTGGEIINNMVKLGGTVSSRYTITNGFDVELYWDKTTGPWADSAYFFFKVQSSSNYFQIYRETAGGNERIVGTDGSTYNYSTYNWDTGYFRFLKVGTNIKLYFKRYSGDSWIERSSFTCVTEEYTISMWRGGSSNPTPSVDNFKLNSGTVVWPERKKIAVTKNDGITQCNIEIESFDPVSRKAVLWTKIPFVHADEDTIIYLYSDNDKADNTTYVGDVGDTPAKAVWDDGFVGVWHMSQCPTGGSNCIKDSTLSANHGTPGGSMTSGDLVDGKIGKSLDFDSVDDYVNVGSDSTLDDVNQKTLEVIFKADTFGEGTYGRFFDKDKFIFHMDGAFSLNRLGLNQGFSTTNGVWMTPNSSIYIGVIYNVALVYDNSSTLNDPLFYIDGTSQVVTKAVSPVGLASSDASDSLYLGNNSAQTGTFDGILDEIRFSNVIRSASWIKATYYSNWNQLITYEQQKYYFAGYTLEDMVPVSRIVRVYSSSNGRLVGEVTSSGTTGYYQVWVNNGDNHYLVCMDAEALPDYNNLIVSKATPYEV